MNLSPFLYEISTHIGLAKVRVLVEHCGGRPLYVPKLAKAETKLGKLLGVETTQILADHYGGQTITIALNAIGDHAQHHAKRRQRIIELLAEGKSRTEVARILGTTERTVPINHPTKTKRKTAMKYKTLTTVHHDSVIYNIGDEIDLDDVEAKPLLEVKAIEPVIKPFARPVEKTALHNSQEY